jgi:hypothetical protein
MPEKFGCQINRFSAIFLQLVASRNASISSLAFSKRTGNRIANKIFWALVREPDGLVANESKSKYFTVIHPKPHWMKRSKRWPKTAWSCLEMKRIEKGRSAEFGLGALITLAIFLEESGRSQNV